MGAGGRQAPAWFPWTLVDSGLSFGKARKAGTESGLSAPNKHSLSTKGLAARHSQAQVLPETLRNMLLPPERNSHWVPVSLLKPQQKASESPSPRSTYLSFYLFIF